MTTTFTIVRRIFIPLLAGLALGISGCGGGGGHSNRDESTPSTKVEGPIAGTPFISATSFPLASVGYEQTEYFVAGTAHSYIARGPLGSDGRWQVDEAEKADYKTRIVVHKPLQAGDFNGTVIIEWLNVSGGLDAAPDWVMAHNELIRSGYAWIGVSAQKVGIDGGGNSLVALHLKAANPERYSSLVHPGDSFSYDMYSQIARAVLKPGAVDPLGGLTIEHVIAAGESQSAFRLTTYINAFALTDKLFDGFFVHSRGNGSAPLSQAPQTDVDTPQIVFVRDDLGLPVLMVQTESDLFLLGSYDDRQPDNDHFRLWEIAGTAHADTYTVAGAADTGDNPDFADVIETDSPVPGIITCDQPINSGPQHFVVSAAVAALQTWIADGVAPATAPRLDVDSSGLGYVYDALGNVTGGIRTPYVDAPIAKLSGEGQGGAGFCFLFGTTALFDANTIATLYPTHATYVSAVNSSVDSAVAAGFLLEPDGVLIKAAAQRSDIGN